MTTTACTYNNYGRHVLEGSVALSAAGAVTATVGDGVTAAKNGVGLYEVTFANPDGFVLNRILGTDVTIRDVAMGTVKDAHVKSLAQQSNGTFLLVLRTTDAASADVDEILSALTLDFRAVIGTRSMTAQL